MAWKPIRSPKVVKPFGSYVWGVEAEGKRILLISGQIPVDAEGELAGVDLESQSRQVFENIQHMVESAGGTMTDVCKLTCYLTDVSKYEAFSRVRNEFFGDNPPASTLIQVAGLVRREFKVEVEAIAVLD